MLKERITKNEPFINKYKQEVINFSPEKDNSKKFEENNITMALIVLHNKYTYLYILKILYICIYLYISIYLYIYIYMYIYIYIYIYTFSISKILHYTNKQIQMN